MRLQGIVVSGIGQGAQFLALEWVARELERHLALTPFPGTLNLRVAPQTRDALFAERRGFLTIANPASPDCPGYLQRVSLAANGRRCDAWLILPEKTLHADVLEIISASSLRDTLGLRDGDTVDVEIVMG